jgi:predicted metal-dependent peptidase
MDIALLLEQHDSIFYKFWTLGKPILDDKIPTAGVYYDFITKDVVLLINEQFWNSLTLTQKCFVISHECMHVIFNHFLRGQNAYKAKDIVKTQVLNRAMDISINHALVNRFGFKREEIDPGGLYCWVDTVFKGTKYETPPLPDDRNFEFYYIRLMEVVEEMIKNKQFSKDGSIMIPGETVDSHESGFSSSEEDDGTGMKEIFDKLNDNISDAEAASVKDMIEKEFKQAEKDQMQSKIAGSGAGNMFKTVTLNKVLKKKKWETVIAKWVKKRIKEEEIEEEQWIRENRRTAGSSYDKNFFIPSEMEVDGLNKVKDKIKLWFFLDTSGSCSHLGNRFFRAAMSVPTDRFEIKVFCFDTKVYPTTLESKKLYGFGGTSFACIERYIQQNCEGKYPDSVWIVTDGYGDNVRPEKPDRWHWFLTEMYTRCIPKESSKYLLSNFE